MGDQVDNSSNTPFVHSGFDHWARMAWWNCHEATVLSFGMLPEWEYDQGRPIFTYSDMMQYLGDESEKLLLLVEREFKKDNVNRIAPKDFFPWLKEKNIQVDARFLDAAIRAGLVAEKEVKTRSSEDGRGSHWKELRFKFVCVALQVAADKNPDVVRQIRKGSGSLNIEGLAKYIDDNRRNWNFLKNSSYGTNLKNIRDTIASALKVTD